MPIILPSPASRRPGRALRGKARQPPELTFWPAMCTSTPWQVPESLEAVLRGGWR